MLGLVLSAWVAPAVAAQVAMSIGAGEVREGQSVPFQVVVTDASPRGLPEVTVPDGLLLEYRGQSQSSMMINFNMTSSVTFSYVLTATRAGKFEIPAALVRTAAGELRSAPLSLAVGERRDDGLDQLVAELGTEVAWVGQVLLYRASFTTDEPRLRGQWRPPEVPGLTAEPGVDPLTPEEQLLQDGKALTRLGLVYPMRAAKAGKLTVPGAVLQAQVPVQRERTRSRDRLGGLFDELGAFSDYATQVYSAPTLPLEVRPLPEEGRPAGFSGLVGRFTVKATPSATEVAVGDTVTLAVEITGDSPLAGVTLPPLAVDGVRAYDDQPVVSAAIEAGALVGRATMKRALVPEAPGQVVVPPVELSFFDPVAGAYAVARTEPVTLRVSGAAGGAQVSSFAQGDTRTEVDALAEDILPVRTGATLSAPVSGRWAWLPLLPGAAWLGAQAAGRWRPRRAVAAEARYDFGDLPAEPEARLAGLDRIFRERVGARLGMAPEAVHREDLARLGDDAAEAERVYRELERLRYGGARGGLPEAEIRALVGRWS